MSSRIKWIVIACGFVIIVILVTVLAILWPQSSNKVQDLGNNTYNVPIGAELVLNQSSGKTTVIWQFDYKGDVVEINWSPFLNETVVLCGIGCKKEWTVGLNTFYFTQNADNSVTIQSPWGFYKT